MAIKKSELYSSLWQSCDELRGGMDASQYKDYVLTLLFVKYVSDKYAGDPYGLIVIPENGSFADMVRLKGDKEIGDKMNKIIGRLAEANSLRGVIDDLADFNDEDKLGQDKEMVDRLTKLVAIFEGLSLSGNRAEGDDLLGDAYEYLMRHFATESGKSKGQFYTPAEVSRVLAQVIGITRETRQDQTVYDPTCGSGSLLLKVADQAPRGLSIYGQEMDNATAALARMNMILHNNVGAEMWQGNTLSNPHWRENGGLKRFDFAVANPPFSYKSWTNGVNVADDEFGRFAYGLPPAKNGDYAFLLHILKSLKSTGKAAVILPHGVLFRGNTEADIRRNLVKQGVIKGIIGLPPNLFYGTGIPACIIVLDKEHAATRTGIFMIDASRGFMKDGNKNRLRSRDIHQIVDVFNRQLAVPRYARLVPFSEIEQHEYNLNIPRYIDSSEPEDIHDLTAHLCGGIPQRDIDALGHYWRVFPTLRDDLFAPAEREGYSAARVAAGEVKATILKHPEFSAFAARTLALYQAWRDARAPRLYGLSANEEPKALIRELAEDLLARFAAPVVETQDFASLRDIASVPLIDKYAIYQLLMDYWADTMQDDVYLIVQDGWQAAGGALRELLDVKEQKNKETPDLVISRKKYKADLIPPALLVARYFAREQAEIEQLQAAREAISAELAALLEEHGGEEGLLAEATNDKGKVTKGGLSDRLKAIVGDPEAGEERAVLEQCQQLLDAESAAGKQVSEVQKKLDEQVFARYHCLNEAEIKTLVVADKWLAALESAINVETQNLASLLAARVKLLEERYADPLPRLVDEVAELTAKVNAHLQRMGMT
ncbi:MAG: type I restriction-modification system subunit M [Chloroflexi bacterium]|nr:type I restriction-modification system subunit M [Chloroflexota bacterium]MCI0646893.1 type I restriction-modification system subunit M [Chloroflexota bacterium]MCI0729102.1 type I restriction-modification system subunit M [Chloroflexota bacterium]